MIVRLKHVHKVTAKGRLYCYFRPTKERLAGEPGSSEFYASYNRVLEKWLAKAEQPGTLGDLMAKYRASPKFAELAPVTKADYLDVMDWLAAIGHVPVALIDTPFVMRVRDKAFKAHKRRFANYVLAVLSILFKWGKPYGHTASNPAAEAPKIARPRNAPDVNRPWSHAELTAVMAAAPTELRIPIALGAYAGIRQGDVLKLTWKAYDGTAIEARQLKTGNPIWVPVHKELRALLDEWKLAHKGKSTTIVTGERGLPFTGNGFRARFFRLVRSLQKSSTIGPGITFHGLRHTAATMLADAGCDNRDIMSITGQVTVQVVEKYVQRADQKRRATAAIAKLEAETDRRKE